MNTDIDYDLAGEYGYYQTRSGDLARFLTSYNGGCSLCEIWLLKNPVSGIESGCLLLKGGRRYESRISANDIVTVPVGRNAPRRVWNSPHGWTRKPGVYINESEEYIHRDDARELAKRGEL